MKDCTENELSEMERREIADRTKAMSEEEISFVLKNIPSRFIFEEMKRRDEIKSRVLSEVRTALKGAI